MTKYQYFCINDPVVYRLGKYLYKGKIVDFFKYSDELRIKVQTNIGLFMFPARKFQHCGSFWLVGDNYGF